MTGQESGADTATEAAIQQQHGVSSTDHKKTMLEVTLIEMLEYILGIMMEMYTEGTTLEDKEEYKWVDFRQLSKVPVKIPATENYINGFRERNPEAEIPKWELLTEKNGSPVTKNIDLDLDVSIGAGLPKNPGFLYQMAEKLSQTQVMGAIGQPSSIISKTELRDFIKKFLNVPLKEDDEAEQEMNQMPQGIPQGMSIQGQSPPLQSPPLQMNATASGLGQGNAPTQGNLNVIRGGNAI